MKNLIASISAAAITLLAAPALAQSNMGQGMSGGSMDKGMEKPKAKAKTKKKSDKMSQGSTDKMDKKDAMGNDAMGKDKMGK